MKRKLIKIEFLHLNHKSWLRESIFPIRFQGIENQQYPKRERIKGESKAVNRPFIVNPKEEKAPFTMNQILIYRLA